MWKRQRAIYSCTDRPTQLIRALLPYLQIPTDPKKMADQEEPNLIVAFTGAFTIIPLGAYVCVMKALPHTHKLTPDNS